jgi:hypothetical protein
MTAYRAARFASREAALAKFARIVAAREVWRGEKLPLQLAACARDGSGADLGSAGKLMRDVVQKRIPQVDRQRPGGGHDGVELRI